MLGPILSVQRSLARPDIRLGSLDEAGTLEDLPEQEETKVYGNDNICRDEILNVPVRTAFGTSVLCEDGEAVEERDDGEEDQRGPCTVGLEFTLEDESVAVDSLCSESSLEANVCDADGHPCEEGCDGGQGLEPFENGSCAGGYGHVGQETDGCRDQHAPDGNTGFGTLEEELRSLLVLSESKQVSRARVQEGVSRGCSRGQNDCVDNGWEDWNSCLLDGNDPRGRCGTRTTIEEIIAVAGNGDTNG